jgi:hypothetical protein
MVGVLGVKIFCEWGKCLVTFILSKFSMNKLSRVHELNTKFRFSTILVGSVVWSGFIGWHWKINLGRILPYLSRVAVQWVESFSGNFSGNENYQQEFIFHSCH